MTIRHLGVLILFSFLTLDTVLSRPALDKAAVHADSSFQFLQHLMSCHKGENLKEIHQLKQYLRRFGYMSYVDYNTEAGVAADDDTFDELLESSLRAYQRNYNLKVTGILDSPTVQQMMEPRCGVPDIVNGSTSMLSGKKRRIEPTGINPVALYSFFRNQIWPTSKTHLTYGFLPGNLIIDRGKFSSVCRQAFAKWSAVSHFTFEEVEDYRGADIKIGFFRGAHGDGADFDGRGGILAHAFAPTAGIFHLDGDESWSTDPNADETDLESVTIHEIGHLLGLGHSSVRDAVMYPSIPRGVKKLNLHGDDIAGIRALYNL
ncbi:metalloendoproteinase 5-MMP-like [Aristolochia californica]|uniref:metalloendoproteinase 5-MMP-like n=1 Tax=Aristolochia californica TaxID=171875 RepID=UPI0035DBE455